MHSAYKGWKEMFYLTTHSTHFILAIQHKVTLTKQDKKSASVITWAIPSH